MSTLVLPSLSFFVLVPPASILRRPLFHPYFIVSYPQPSACIPRQPSRPSCPIIPSAFTRRHADSDASTRHTNQQHRVWLVFRSFSFSSIYLYYVHTRVCTYDPLFMSALIFVSKIALVNNPCIDFPFLQELIKQLNLFLVWMLQAIYKFIIGDINMPEQRLMKGDRQSLRTIRGRQFVRAKILFVKVEIGLVERCHDS